MSWIPGLMLVGTGLWCIVLGLATRRTSGWGLANTGIINATVGGYLLLLASAVPWRVPAMVGLGVIFVAASAAGIRRFLRYPPQVRGDALHQMRPLGVFVAVWFLPMWAIVVLFEFTPIGQSRLAMNVTLAAAGLIAVAGTIQALRMAGGGR